MPRFARALSTRSRTVRAGNDNDLAPSCLCPMRVDIKANGPGQRAIHWLDRIDPTDQKSIVQLSDQGNI